MSAQRYPHHDDPVELKRNQAILAFIREFPEPRDWRAMANIARWRETFWPRKTTGAAVQMKLLRVWRIREFLDNPLELPVRPLNQRARSLILRRHLMEAAALRGELPL